LEPRAHCWLPERVSQCSRRLNRDDLEAIRKHLGREQLTLLGHSWGVVPAALYAMQPPQRVRRMILVATVPLERSELERAFEAMADGRDKATLRWYDRAADPRAASRDPEERGPRRCQLRGFSSSRASGIFRTSKRPRRFLPPSIAF
jgi:pimeloyl-ACP methyl ester carboxylesterase